jgi:hypothetical protein
VIRTAEEQENEKRENEKQERLWKEDQDDWKN